MRAPERFETERLCLRRPRAEDVEAIYAYASDPEVTRYLGWPRHTHPDATRAFLAHCDEEWQRGPSGAYLIELLERPGVIGGTGLHASDARSATTGYLLRAEHRRQGYAREALAAVVALAARLGMREVQAFVHPDNADSLHLLARCGFERRGFVADGVVFPQLDPERPLPALRFTRDVVG